MKIRLKLGFWHYQIIGWIVFLINNSGLIWIEYKTTNDSIFLISDFYIILFLLTIVLRYIYRFIYKSSRSFITYFAVSTAFSILGSILLAESRILNNYLFGNYDPWLSVPRDFRYFTYIPRDAWPIFVWSILYFGIKYWQDLLNEKERLAKAELMASKSQLKMLRYQINPHFLFNSLYSIKALTYENNEKAGLMITELAEFLRTTLKFNDKIFIPIKSELEIIQKYLSIEKIRFEERLNYHLVYDNDILNYEILCFITQPLVENAIKHGLAKRIEGINLTIRFYKVDDYIGFKIENDGQYDQNDITKGTGIINIKERLVNAYSDKFYFNIWEEKGKVKVLLKIPINI